MADASYWLDDNHPQRKSAETLLMAVPVIFIRLRYESLIKAKREEIAAGLSVSRDTSAAAVETGIRRWIEREAARLARRLLEESEKNESTEPVAQRSMVTLWEQRHRQALETLHRAGTEYAAAIHDVIRQCGLRQTLTDVDVVVQRALSLKSAP